VDILNSSIGVVVGLASIYTLRSVILTWKRGRAILDETRLDGLRKIEQAEQSRIYSGELKHWRSR
jgi:hypothetical protein